MLSEILSLKKRKSSVLLKRGFRKLRFTKTSMLRASHKREKNLMRL